MAIECDSFEYEQLVNAAMMIKDVPGMTIELGVRRGGGSAHIIHGLLENNDSGRTHICVDPWGNIDYVLGDGLVGKCDYTNNMRNTCIADLYQFVQHKPVNLVVFVLEDSEFFDRFKDGVPVYSETKQILNQYALVHYDGPHDVINIKKEIDFFATRTPKGGIWVFDDVDLYDHSEVESLVLSLGFETIVYGKRKASYRKI